MGNKLCAPLWKKSYRDEDSPWSAKRDSHLLRLWAEIFEVKCDSDGELKWERVSEDVAPVNITCVQDVPETVFQITSYNRHVEKIFDVKLIQPGTKVHHSSECFVHWKDPRTNREWGLNFTCSGDARRFKDCCMTPSNPISRKASSAASLKLSPPKRVRKQQRSTSQPSSPVTKPRRAISTPDELARGAGHDTTDSSFDEQDCGSPGDNPGHLVESLATMPRMRQRQIPDAQGVFIPNQINKPVSNTSVYDNVSNYNYPSKKVSRYDNISAPGSIRTGRNNSRQAETRLLNNATEEEGLKSILRNQGPEETIDHTSSNHNSFLDAHHKLRTFSKEPIAIGGPCNSPTVETQPGIGAPPPQLGEEAPKANHATHLSPPNKTHSSSSQNWPQPPPQVVPGAQPTPLCSASFDSDTLKRMLRGLPDSFQGQIREEEIEYYDNPTSTPPTSTSESASVESSPYRTSSAPHNHPIGSNGHEVNPKSSSETHLIRGSPMSKDDHMISHGAAPERGPTQRPNKMLLEYELQLRNACARDSYPDSGIGGMNFETTGSQRSGDSGKSYTLPAGIGLGSMTKSSTASSSVSGSSSGKHGHGNEVRSNLYTSSEVSDNSEGEEEEDGTEGSDSSIHTMPSESQAFYTRQTGAVRKAGYLVVKNWLIHKKRKVELASKRNWKKYWVCLKGTSLQFFTCDDGTSISDDTLPRHMLVIEGGIAQAVPEHPKRDHIFALSTAFGDAYLFQAPSQIELENWISGIHSACASSFARQHGKDNTLKLLRSEIHKLDNSIDIDIKMKKMAELQLTVVTDPKSKTAIIKQILQWDENLEKLFIEQYRLRCYMFSLQGSELPNPKTLLSNVSKSTKALLGRLGVFTVTSFHALVCARTPMTSANLYSRANRKKGILSTFKADGVTKMKPRVPRPFSPSQSCSSCNNKGHGGRAPLRRGGSSSIAEQDESQWTYICRHGKAAAEVDENAVVDFSKKDSDGSTETIPAGAAETINFGDNLCRIGLPNNQSIVIGVHEKMTVQDVLEVACNKRQLNPNDHYIRFKMPGHLDNFRVPDKTIFLEKEEYDSIEICPKIIFQSELVREKESTFGFHVEAELAEDSERDDELCVFVSDVAKGGLAQRKGLIFGDEILVINSKVVADLDMVFIETLLQEAHYVTLTVRSCRSQKPYAATALMQHADVYIDNMMCPPPPSQARISEKVIGELIVPAPHWVQEDKDSNGMDDDSSAHSKSSTPMSGEQIHTLLKSAEQVTHFCRLSYEQKAGEAQRNHEPPTTKPLSDAQKLRKVIMELVNTERQYNKDLNCLIERYLEPLKEETFLSSEDIENLFGNIQEIVQFQKLFLQSLEEAIELEPDFLVISEPREFREDCVLRRVLFSLGGSFLFYANHFKLYSSFCASHSKAQKVLNPDWNSPLKEFLRARNPKQQHSSTLESYLIKPIQRILKYPLLLQQLKNLTDPDTDEHHHLSEALKGMEAVAEHINEMQKIYEEYGQVFDDLMKQHKEAHPHSKFVDLNVGDLQMYGTVEWLTIGDCLGKVKKGTELITTIFVFKTGVVLLCKEKIKTKKKNKPGAIKAPSAESLDLVRYQTLIPVKEVQVKCNNPTETDSMYWWELVHLRSETEGRPERLYQMASGSLEARNDFLKTIHQIIRDSVRKMTLPSSKQQTTRIKHVYVPFGGKRLEHLAPNQRSLSKKRGKPVQIDLQRHSMNLEEQKQRNKDSSPDSDFRTRSKTFSDLNDMDLNDSNGPYGQISASHSKIDEGSRSGSAKLLYSSNNPLNYSSGSISKPKPEVLGSPIWKPRHFIHGARGPRQIRSPLVEERLEQGVFTTSGYGEYSDVMYDEHGSSLILSPPNSYLEHEHTDC